MADGLRRSPRRLDCRYLYDARGSDLFEEITRQPEYYLTRAETEILARNAAEIRSLCGSATLVELGSGSSTKTRLLLDAWRDVAGARYAPVDTSESALRGAEEELRADFPWLAIESVHGGFEDIFARLAEFSPATVAFLGSTIGNLEDPALDEFLATLASHLPGGDHFLLGFDLVKDPAVLEAAYDDAASVTAEFTRNLFHRMNRELGTSIQVDRVQHIARWNPTAEQIEIDAQFTDATLIHLPGEQESFHIAAGERIRTEVSRKFHIEQMHVRLKQHGLDPVGTWQDSGARVALVLARREEPARGHGADASRCLTDLGQSRARLLSVASSLSEAQLRAQHDPLMSPILWDLGHIANFEEQWTDAAAGRAASQPRRERDARFDAIRHPRASRVELKLPTFAEARTELAAVREQTEALLAQTDGKGKDPLLARHYLFRMLAQHEAQHTETILQAIGLIRHEEPFGERPPAEPQTATIPDASAMIEIPAGLRTIGSDDRSRAYDNERPRHEIELSGFRIARHPVTNDAFRGFVEDGGYDRAEFWSEAGNRWRLASGCRAPMRWFRAGGTWWEDHYGQRDPLAPLQPVVQICFFEAEAFARWCGKRLPTEFEWEVAAAAQPATTEMRTWPWGEREPDASLADLDSPALRPAEIGSFPQGRSAFGCEQMIGSVWEWTSSEFLPWPGFRPFPYAEYSEAHFGQGFRVLRGGSWATQRVAIRNTFRNWDLPQRRQLMAGLRLAEDLPDA